MKDTIMGHAREYMQMTKMKLEDHLYKTRQHGENIWMAHLRQQLSLLNDCFLHNNDATYDILA